MNEVVHQNFGHVLKQLHLRCRNSKDFLERILCLRRKYIQHIGEESDKIGLNGFLFCYRFLDLLLHKIKYLLWHFPGNTFITKMHLFPARYYDISDPGHVKCSWYLFVLSIPVCSEAFGRMQLDGGAADHLDATFSVFCTQRSHTTVNLKKKLSYTYIHQRAQYYQRPDPLWSWFLNPSNTKDDSNRRIRFVIARTSIVWSVKNFQTTHPNWVFLVARRLFRRRPARCLSLPGGKMVNC